MYYGHGSWIGLVVLGAVFATRYFGTRRHRGHHGPSASPFTGGSPSGPAATSGPAGDTGVGMPPGWFRDPFVRHGERYWSGVAWTEHVTDDGIPGLDPPGPGRTGD